MCSRRRTIPRVSARSSMQLTMRRSVTGMAARSSSSSRRRAAERDRWLLPPPLLLLLLPHSHAGRGAEAARGGKQGRRRHRQALR